MLHEKLEAWTKRFWWLRGVLSAFAMLAIANEGLSWERFSFLRAAHATLTYWNVVAETIGSRLSDWLHLPKLEAPEVNSIILCSATIIPFYAASFYKKQSRLFYVRWVVMMIVMTPIYFMYFSWVLDTNSHFLISFAIITTALFLQFRVVLLKFPEYAKGMISVVLCLATLELMYLLHLPIVRDAVDAFSCRTLDISAEECLNSR